MSSIRALLNKSSSPSPSVSSNTTATSTTHPLESATPSPTNTPRLLSPFPSNSRLHTGHHHILPLPITHLPPNRPTTVTAKPKVIKDAPVFTPGPTRGPVRYPPQVYTMGSVGDTKNGSDDDESMKSSSASSSSSSSSDGGLSTNIDIDLNTTPRHVISNKKTSLPSPRSSGSSSASTSSTSPSETKSRGKHTSNTKPPSKSKSASTPKAKSTAKANKSSISSASNPPTMATRPVSTVAPIDTQSLITLQDHHVKFALYPSQESIAVYPRHIPYNSEKRIFLNQTGRDFFEVFQYTFRVPSGPSIKTEAGSPASAGKGKGKSKMTDSSDGDSKAYAGEMPGGGDGGKTWTMLWDYNTGLVRTTPLFKCCGYGKTTPAKMLNKNIGLRDICHSITGGALVAQGYWIPHLAAKHIAATFCYSIRYALTPVFGLDFVDLCVPPSDSRFGSMLIDEAITTQCRQEAHLYKIYELQHPTVKPVVGNGSSRPVTPRGGSPVSGQMSPVVAGGSAYGKGGARPVPPALRFKPINASKIAVAGKQSDDESTSAAESEVHTSEPEDYLLSPANTMSPSSSPRFRDVWATSARKDVAGRTPRSHPRLDDDLPSPKSGIHIRGRAKRGFAEVDEQDWNLRGGVASAYSTPMQSPKMRKLKQWQGRREVEMEDGYEAEAEEMQVDRRDVGGKRLGPAVGWNAAMGPAALGFSVREAADVLLSLGTEKKFAGRRASA